MPVGFRNLMKKRTATLKFLHAHHEDLKNAVEMAGVNIHNSQETWHRVFRDAERAVLKMSEEAFPELGFLGDDVTKFVLWHEKGNYFGLKLIPKKISSLFGDQNGLYLSACREYRSSMNYIAKWAQDNNLMEYAGAECIPISASLMESILAKNYNRIKRLNYQDGEADALNLKKVEEYGRILSVEEVAKTLREINIFKVLQADEIAALAKRARPIEVGHLERVIIQGNTDNSLYILQDGDLEVVTRKNDAEHFLASLSKGAIVGEFAFLTGEERSATVRAIDYALVIEVSVNHLKPLAEQRPALLGELSLVMEKQKSEHMRRVNQKSLLKKITATILGT